MCKGMVHADCLWKIARLQNVCLPVSRPGNISWENGRVIDLVGGILTSPSVSRAMSSQSLSSDYECCLSTRCCWLSQLPIGPAVSGSVLSHIVFTMGRTMFANYKSNLVVSSHCLSIIVSKTFKVLGMIYKILLSLSLILTSFPNTALHVGLLDFAKKGKGGEETHRISFGICKAHAMCKHIYSK